MSDFEKDWYHTLDKLGAIFEHDGNPKRPHARMTSDLCSGHVVNCGILEEHPPVFNKACYELITIRQAFLPSPGQIDWVVGSAMGSVKMAHVIAGYYSDGVKSAYTEPEVIGEDRFMKLKRSNIPKGARVLRVEDVFNTGLTTTLTTNELLSHRLQVCPPIAVLVNRSRVKSWNGSPIVSLVHKPLPVYKQKECPYCRDGSEAIRPKGRENWDRLTRKY